MILYHALGGGLGHVRRASAVVHTLALAGPITLVSASPHAARLCPDFDIVSPPLTLERDRAGLRDWLCDLLARLRPSQIYLDAFPAGVLGEWCGLRPPPGARLHHVARYVRWDRYGRRLDGPPPPLDRVHVLEPLSPDHAGWLARHAARVERLALRYPPAPPREAVRAVPGTQCWLVVHSGPDHEIRTLVEQARECAMREVVDASITLVSPHRPADLEPTVDHRAVYPASSLFAGADRIFSACGFNSLWEMRPYRDRQWLMPFPRALDDQHLRARRALGARAGLSAMQCQERSPAVPPRGARTNS